MAFSILIVDDEEELGSSLAEIFSSRGYDGFYTTNPLEVTSLLNIKDIDLIIMDIKMPELGGIDLLKIVKKQNRRIPIIVITGYPSIENAVQAMKYGALNFYVKPINIQALLDEVQQVVIMQGSKTVTGTTPVQHEIITKNREMRTLIENLKKAAPTDAPVIIYGESGTGKELAANFLHYMSGRKEGPFIKVNCAAIPDNLLESELFGHERGSFTDAKERHVGKFELASGGSIFLDEIGDMSLKTQSKILRVLQEKKFERLGGKQLLSTDTRVICATNKDIHQMLQEGRFRDDLYYRLCVISVDLPPLRKRKEDIMLLTGYFLKCFNEMYGKDIRFVSAEVKSIFLAHSWPGNVRELKNCVERAVIFCDDDTINVDDLSSQYREIVTDRDLNHFEEVYRNLSREMITEALKKTGGSKQKAAELLKINRKTLYNKMKKLGMR
ncbi:MAG: Fis family transcriptional regulator [Spirochaetes bacterium DG_61]|nr:MAG: Fis family transcriptional regulator [Spirochaetes bacterium DG_61]